MAVWQGYLQNVSDLCEEHSVQGSYLGGHAVGIIAIDLVYPKLPGNVVNATTYTYPVLYKKVSFEIEQLFTGDSTLENMILDAAKELVADGARAIIGACGYFAHFQQKVTEEVDVPVFLSSLCQLPMIKAGLKSTQKILVVCANGDNANRDFFQKVSANIDDCVVLDIGTLPSFAPIRWGKTTLDNGRLTRELVAYVDAAVKQHPELGAILLECSDLPPYACEIQRATGLPVFDFISMINWVQHAVVQKRYFGYF